MDINAWYMEAVECFNPLKVWARRQSLSSGLYKFIDLHEKQVGETILKTVGVALAAFALFSFMMPWFQAITLSGIVGYTAFYYNLEKQQGGKEIAAHGGQILNDFWKSFVPSRMEHLEHRHKLEREALGARQADTVEMRKMEERHQKEILAQGILSIETPIIIGKVIKAYYSERPHYA